MKTRILGKDLQVSAVGFGCMGISHAYGEPMEKSDAVALLRSAAESGCTFFDTAECYVGEGSNNEEIVGEALAPFRGKVQIATKFGVRHEGTSLLCDSRAETIRASVEGSLRRLNVECLDLYYQHRIDPKFLPKKSPPSWWLRLSRKEKSRTGAFPKRTKNICGRLMRSAR